MTYKNQLKKNEDVYEAVNKLNSENGEKSITDGELSDHKLTF